MPILRAGIEDDPHNSTRFLVVGRQASGPTGRDKTSILFAMRNEPGTLYRILEPLARLGSTSRRSNRVRPSSDMETSSSWTSRVIAPRPRSRRPCTKSRSGRRPEGPRVVPGPTKGEHADAVESLANQHILGVAPYEPGKPIEELERELMIHNPIKLASNETPCRRPIGSRRRSSRRWAPSTGIQTGAASISRQGLARSTA